MTNEQIEKAIELNKVKTYSSKSLEKLIRNQNMFGIGFLEDYFVNGKKIVFIDKSTLELIEIV